MWTYWIVWICDAPKIFAVGYFFRPIAKRSIGPYWTKDEAEHMLDKWTK